MIISALVPFIFLGKNGRKIIGITKPVITSYSIHYTKLYDSVNRKKSFAVFFALTGILINCYCQNWDPKELEDKIDSYIIPLADSQSFMGSILIAEKDSIVFLKSFGYANLEHLVPNSSSTVYRIGSMTKSFTATAIMLLIDKNKISVESKLSDFISDYPNGNRITIHQLLTHTSGIPDYTKFVITSYSIHYTKLYDTSLLTCDKSNCLYSLNLLVIINPS